MTEENTYIQVCLEGLDSGDSTMLVRLFDHLRPRLAKVVSLYMNPSLRTRADAEDVLQEAYVDAAQQIENYTSRRDEIDFYVWLRGITLQRLSKFHRFHLQTQQRAVSRQLDLPDESSLLLGRQLIARGSSPSEHVRKQELRQEVQQAVENLSDSDREIILMRHFEDLSNQEVAQALGLEPSTATMRYGRALVRLKTALAENSAFGESTT